MSDTPTYLAPPHTNVTYVTTQQIPTVVRLAEEVLPSDMGGVFDETFRTLVPALQERGIEIAGPALALHHRIPGATMSFELGFPVGAPLDGELEAGGITFYPSSMPATQVATISHVGSYDGLGRAWGDLMQRVAADGHRTSLPFWEVYVTAPSPEMDPSTLRTDLVVPYED
ncbi:GyrI-like domain-containing protein [Janibacter limosus]|uniref:AraC family transcriptional regulator n=1 Tax=Janibacter limosus TaxID=53458 RepID=A0A4P6MWK6_9MICO|nr:GyrI-like domain-containing protein [Janibacter limosus]QBF47406.1 AraC family transcriptional regulator [Janibacter limosus]